MSDHGAVGIGRGHSADPAIVSIGEQRASM